MQKTIITTAVSVIALILVAYTGYYVVSRMDATDQKVNAIIQFINNAQQHSVSPTK